MPWRPEYDGEYPTLGWAALSWMTEMLCRPDTLEYEPLVLTPEQARFVLKFYRLDPVTGQRVYRRAVWSRSKKHGKAECLTAEVPTPSGWCRVGDLQVGSELFGSDGQVVRVTALHPVIYEPGYRVTFSDGSSSVFHGDHEFTVGEIGRDGKRRSVTLSVGQMQARGLVAQLGNARVARFALPDMPVLQLPEADVPVDPYILGYWLGDGDSDCARVTVSLDDLPSLVGHLDGLGYEHGQPQLKPGSHAVRMRIGARWLQKALRGLGVLGNKHIPGAYLRGSYEQRLALVRGLMDSDGSIDAKGRAEFCTTSRALAEGMHELLHTLGVKTRVRRNSAALNGRVVGERYRLSFTPRCDVFLLERKSARLLAPVKRAHARTIRAIEPVAPTAMRCITVSAADGLYLTGRSFIATHNSPLMGAIGAFEALGPCVPSGWDAEGRPVGKPWCEVRSPLVQFAAVNEDQTRNAYEPLLHMLRNGPVVDYYDIDPMDSFVALPMGRIEYITAAALSKEGGRPVWCALDQTESWIPSNGGVKLAAVLRRNLGPLGGTSIETPNAYRPGSGSVAEETFKYGQLIEQGLAADEGLLIDHREAPADTDLANRQSLLKGLAYAYGDSAQAAGGWVDLERVAAEIMDPATDPQDSRQFYLNQVVAASDSWLSQPEWLAVEDKSKKINDGDTVVLGFDGSRGRVRGRADATALMGMRVEDMHLFEVRVWEAKLGDKDWTAPAAEVDREVEEAFKRWNVVGFYADPSGWQTHVTEWEAKYHRRLKTRATAREPIALWPTGRASRVSWLTEQFYQAVVHKEMTHDGSPALMRHVLNARRRQNNKGGYLLYKEYPESPNKIDAAYASIMAFKACQDVKGKVRSRQGVENRKALMW